MASLTVSMNDLTSFFIPHLKSYILLAFLSDRFAFLFFIIPPVVDLLLNSCTSLLLLQFLIVAS